MKNKIIYYSFRMYSEHTNLNHTKEWVTNDLKKVDVNWCNQLIKERHEK